MVNQKWQQEGRDGCLDMENLGILSSQKGGNRDAFSGHMPSDLPAHFPKVVGAALAGHVLGDQHSPRAAVYTDPGLSCWVRVLPGRRPHLSLNSHPVS